MMVPKSTQFENQLLILYFSMQGSRNDHVNSTYVYVVINILAEYRLFVREV